MGTSDRMGMPEADTQVTCRRFQGRRNKQNVLVNGLTYQRNRKEATAEAYRRSNRDGDG